jgi:putative transposase
MEANSMFDSFRTRVAAARQSDALFFAAIIPEENIASNFGEASGILDSARIYTTAVTLWTFLTQVLSPDHGCVNAVAKLIAFRASKNLSIPSAETGAYCIARDKLDEEGMQRTLCQTGKDIDQAAPDQWLWLGHRVITGDGTTVTMPDTSDNQKEYPQPSTQKKGCGFPIMRMVVLFALATGVVLETAMGKYKGKLTAEISLFRQIDEIIQENDVFLGDRAYSGWFDIARLAKRGAHSVLRKHQQRKTDFRRGKRLGKDDHIESWPKPPRPEWMSIEEYESYPDAIDVREVRVRVQTPGFRTKEVLVVTDLLDPLQYSKDDLAALYRRRWQAELNLRSLKTAMQMEHLRCKEPHRVRNEIRAHMIAYNLIRQLMCEAAVKGNVQPWQISFKNTMQTLNEMLPILSEIENYMQLVETMLDCCLKHLVGNRPDRYEPRVVKRRPKPYTFMTKPRDQYKPGESKDL